MIPEPLNHLKDTRPPARSIAGHFFDSLSDRCTCGKAYSDVAAAPETAIGDDRQAGFWCHQGILTRFEWEQIAAENSRIMECCRS